MTFPALSANTASGYFLTKSLRFRQSATAYMQRTPASNGSRTTWTWSGWIKLSKPGVIFESNGNGTLDDAIVFSSSNNTLGFYVYNSAYVGQLQTTAVYRDYSAWYHVVAVWDTTNATSTERMRLYVNGSRVTAFGTATYPSQNAQSTLNTATAHGLGAWPNGGLYGFDGYLAEVNFIDGQALTPSSFGSTNALTGVWQPAKYTGTYGTNGFYLPFTNTTSTTTLGYDFSGNSNNWTTNNFSLTAGATYDSMTDVPTLTSATAANYCVMNPISNPNGPIFTLSNGNLSYSCSASSGNAPKMAILGTMGMSSGKWYWEATETSSNSNFGIASGLVYGGNANGPQNAIIYPGGAYASAATYTGTTPTYTSGDVIGLAFDAGAKTLNIYKNNTYLGQFAGIESTVSSWFPIGTVNASAANTSNTWNFGQQGFNYTPPSGFKALNTYNLPDSTIVAGNKYFDATLYTGNGSTNTITNAGGFKPDFIWAKSRSVAGSYHAVYDSVRGSNNLLYPNGTDAENNASNLGMTINSNGFSLNGSNSSFNTNASSQVGWQWQAGQGTTSSNTSGSITSTVSVNASAGFSIVTYSGTGANATVGHGLGVAPQFVVVKRRNSTGDWCVWNLQTAATYGSDRILFLNSTDAATAVATVFNSSSPTSSVINIGTNPATNASGGTYVAYCWSEIAGFSKFGSYTGNGSTDGPFVYTGFRPKFVIWKITNYSGDWQMMDTSINSYNVAINRLFPNLSNAEASNASVDFLSNGFKIRDTNSSDNFSGGTYIFAAFSENPFKNALAR